jgi:alpha-galactosidase
MAGQTILLENDTIRVAIRIADNRATFFGYLLPTGREPLPSCSPYHDDHSLPLVEIRLSGEGNASHKTAQALVGGCIAQRLRYRSHRKSECGDGKRSQTLDVELHDEKSSVTVISHLTIFQGLPFLRSSVTVRNDSLVDVVVNQVPSVVIGGLTSSPEWWHDYDVSYANNTWFREAQWITRSLPDVGVDDYGIYGLSDYQHASLATFRISSWGTFSTQGKPPMCMFKRPD